MVAKRLIPEWLCGKKITINGTEYNIDSFLPLENHRFFSHHASVTLADLVLHQRRKRISLRSVLKEYHTPEGSNLLYAAYKDPLKLIGSVKNAFETITSIPRGRSLIPQLYASDGRAAATLEEFFPGPSLYDLLITVSSEDKLKVLKNVIYNLANFHAVLSNITPSKYYDDRKNMGIFHNQHEGELVEYFNRCFDHHNQNHNNGIEERVKEVYSHRRRFSQECVFQHGDNSIFHSIYQPGTDIGSLTSSTISRRIDFERFELLPPTQDLAKVSMGGEISIGKMSFDDVCYGLEYYFAIKTTFEHLFNGRLDKRRTKNLLHDIDQLTTPQGIRAYLCHETFRREDVFCQHFVSYLADCLEESIHLLATYSRYPPSRIKELSQKWDKGENYIIDSKKENIKSIFKILSDTSSSAILGYVQYNKDALEYFRKMGSLIQDLRIVDLSDYLDSLTEKRIITL